MSHENYYRVEAVEGASNRSFGLVFSGVFFLVALSPLFSGGSIRFWALIAGSLLLLAACVKPTVLSGVNRLWIRLGGGLHKVVSPVLLAMVFFAVITPFAVVMRIFRKDQLGLVREPEVDSYWQKRAATVQDMKYQF